MFNCCCGARKKRKQRKREELFLSLRKHQKLGKLVSAKRTLAKYNENVMVSPGFEKIFPTPTNEITPSFMVQRKSAQPVKSEIQELISIIKQGRPSSPSQMKTEEITEVIRCKDTIADAIESNGYQLCGEIGKGSYAIVYKAKDLITGQIVACKVIDMTRASTKQSLAVKNELYILESIDHPHIIKLYKHFIIETAYSRRCYIFMQMAKESLSVSMRRSKFGLPEAQAKKMFAQMVCALNHMHEKGIAHRDIKMGNILLDEENNCLLTDFGLSSIAYRISKGGKILSNKFCGTIPYMAPEILLSKDSSHKYDPFLADIWALGVVLYCMVNRGYPFSEGSKMIEQQLSHKIRFSKKIQFEPSSDLVDLMHRLLEPDVDFRIRMPELMAHPWISEEVENVEENYKIFLQQKQQQPQKQQQQQQ